MLKSQSDDLVRPLSAGQQVLSVAESDFAWPKSFEAQAEAGMNYFVAYGASKGLLLGWGLLSGGWAKTQTQALVDLKEIAPGEVSGRARDCCYRKNSYRCNGYEG
ncbi:MAG: hypothetical protein GZ093_15155 [Rhodoferax sp.]|uniref:hypothetical protein n=1 Tax=Rhodoferax sp. TaxID=50421 RepID=UPI0013FF4473|nr:hypothetical protein [Rhodoferax sp.]NDP40066.1 hypothetical protein [Rhodoferax sp.]